MYVVTEGWFFHSIKALKEGLHHQVLPLCYKKVKTENPHGPCFHHAHDYCRALKAFTDGLKDEDSIYMSHH